MICNGCLKDKSSNEFYPSARRYPDRLHECKRCRQENYDLQQSREWNMKSKYGLSPEDIDVLLKSQNNKCPGGCGKDATCIDHDHANGNVRGMLCRHCNLALGHAYDNPEVLHNLAIYLESQE